MKLRMLPIVFASLLLVGCGSQEGSTSTSSTVEPSTSVAPSWYYLGFMSDQATLRVDLFDIPEGLQISYGNTALGQTVNNLMLNANSKFTINKNLTEQDVLNIIIVKEKSNSTSHQYTIDVNPAIEGDKLTEYFEEIINKEFAGFDRSYVAFSVGKTVKWTEKLNNNMDREIKGQIPVQE